MRNFLCAMESVKNTKIKERFSLRGRIIKKVCSETLGKTQAICVEQDIGRD